MGWIVKSNIWYINYNPGLFYPEVNPKAGYTNYNAALFNRYEPKSWVIYINYNAGLTIHFIALKSINNLQKCKQTWL